MTMEYYNHYKFAFVDLTLANMMWSDVLIMFDAV